MSPRKPRILFYDVEITPLKGWSYGIWDTNVIDIEQHSYIMCFSYKWSDDKKIYNISLPDFESYTSGTTDDYEITKCLWELMDEADIVVAHNANGFDNKVANTRFIIHGMPPPSPYKSVDTLQVARRVGKFPSNSLDALAKQLGIGSKSDVKHGSLWQQCIAGDKKAWKDMVKYNNMDVELLAGIYYRLLPYINNHPNIAILSQAPYSCPKCGSTKNESRGYRYTNTGAYRRLMCNDCHGWFSERVHDKDIIRPTYVNF